MEHKSRTRLLTALLLAVVFATGILVGLAADNGLGATTPEVVAEKPDAEESPEERTPMWAKVGPTATQAATIDSIVQEHRQRMDDLHAEFRSAYNPRYEALIEETRQAILGVFDAKQAAQYEALLNDYDRRRAERREKENRD
jgi:hypothetical protein